MNDTGPQTHITSLAMLHKDFCIQMVNPEDLFYALDCSSDLNESLGYTMNEHFADFLHRKLADCTEWYTTNLATLGVQEPICVIIRSDDGRWQMDNGHHRLAWALWNNITEIPVIFDDSGMDDDSTMGYLVQRANVEAYHDQIEEILVDEAAEVLVAETDVFLAVRAEQVHDGRTASLIPTPRIGRHRAGGRHRAYTK